MRKKIDESTKAPRSDRLRGWWFRGVDADLPPVHKSLSGAMQTHLEGMASHALDMERVAAIDAARIRQEALSSANTVVGHVERLESQLAEVESQYGRAMEQMRSELADLRGKLAHEAELAEAAWAGPQPVLSAVPTTPAQLPVNGDAAPAV